MLRPAMTPMTRSSPLGRARRRAIAALALAALVASGCGDDDGESIGSGVTATAADTTTSTEASTTTSPAENELVDPDPDDEQGIEQTTSPDHDVPAPIEDWDVVSTAEVTSLDLVAPCPNADAFEAPSISGTMTEYESPDGQSGMQVVVATGDPDEIDMVENTWDDFIECVEGADIEVSPWDGPADDTIGYTATVPDGPGAPQQWLSLWAGEDRIVGVTGIGSDTEDLVVEVFPLVR